MCPTLPGLLSPRFFWLVSHATTVPRLIGPEQHLPGFAAPPWQEAAGTARQGQPRSFPTPCPDKAPQGLCPPPPGQPHAPAAFHNRPGSARAASTRGAHGGTAAGASPSAAAKVAAVPRGHSLHPAPLPPPPPLSHRDHRAGRGGGCPAASPVPLPSCERKEEAAAAAATPVGGGAAGAEGPARGGGHWPGGEPAARSHRVTAVSLPPQRRCRSGVPAVPPGVRGGPHRALSSSGVARYRAALRPAGSSHGFLGDIPTLPPTPCAACQTFLTRELCKASERCSEIRDERLPGDGAGGAAGGGSAPGAPGDEPG